MTYYNEFKIYGFVFPVTFKIFRYVYIIGVKFEGLKSDLWALFNNMNILSYLTVMGNYMLKVF